MLIGSLDVAAVTSPLLMALILLVGELNNVNLAVRVLMEGRDYTHRQKETFI